MSGLNWKLILQKYTEMGKIDIKNQQNSQKSIFILISIPAHPKWILTQISPIDSIPTDKLLIRLDFDSLRQISGTVHVHFS